MEQDDIRVLYNYLVMKLFPAVADFDAHSSSTRSRSVKKPFVSYLFSFISKCVPSVVLSIQKWPHVIDTNFSISKQLSPLEFVYKLTSIVECTELKN